MLDILQLDEVDLQRCRAGVGLLDGHGDSLEIYFAGGGGGRTITAVLGRGVVVLGRDFRER